MDLPSSAAPRANGAISFERWWLSFEAPYQVPTGRQLARRITFWSQILVLFMVIERFADNDMVPIYQRVPSEGRMLREGLEYLDSWVQPNFARGFQLMRCDDLRMFQEWTLNWRGSGATFEIVPVRRGDDGAHHAVPLSARRLNVRGCLVLC